MAKIEILTGSSRRARTARREFTVVLLPVYEPAEPRVSNGKSKRRRLPDPTKPAGFQVTVPSLPGIVTFGRSGLKRWEWRATQSSAIWKVCKLTEKKFPAKTALRFESSEFLPK